MWNGYVTVYPIRKGDKIVQQIMGLDTLNMLILIFSGVQEFSEQNTVNASPDF